jgi:hypothetical protein
MRLAVLLVLAVVSAALAADAAGNKRAPIRGVRSLCAGTLCGVAGDTCITSSASLVAGVASCGCYNVSLSFARDTTPADVREIVLSLPVSADFSAFSPALGCVTHVEYV